MGLLRNSIAINHNTRMNQKVIVFDMALAKGVIDKGETDGKLVDKYYLKVNGELYHSACVLQDTSEAQCALELVVKASRAAEEAKSFASMLGARLLRHYSIAKK